jgi:hypothetical protein
LLFKDFSYFSLVVGDWEPENKIKSPGKQGTERTGLLAHLFLSNSPIPDKQVKLPAGVLFSKQKHCRNLGRKVNALIS